MTEYGEVHISKQFPLIERADPVVLCSLSVFTDAHSWFLCGADVLHPGYDADDEPVYYRVTGWSPEHRSLIAQRCNNRGDLLPVPAPAGQEGGLS